jgi:peptidyl-prolyl cis-trans isomerase-like protein 2
LDGKHTIFGRVVGGMDTLSAMEKIERDNKDRPIEDIIIQSTTIFVDPYAEIDETLAAQRADELERLEKERKETEAKKKPKVKEEKLKVYREGVGKYINPKRK